MALTVTEVKGQREYIKGVMVRVDHHARSMNEIALALVDAILWRKDDAEPIKVMAHGSETKNVLWVHINSPRYAFAYNHDASKIEMRLGGTHGSALPQVSNAISLVSRTEIYRHCEGMGRVCETGCCHTLWAGSL